MANRGDDEPAGMSPENAARWRSARTLADLGELTALFLEGEITETPSHGGPPDPETGPLIPVLAAVNRAGFVTHQSQPGIPLDEDGSAQRANVSGFADDDAFTRLMAAAAGSDLIITAARAGDDDWGPLITITLDMGEEFTWDGGATSRSILQDNYSETCHPDAIQALTGAWQVTLIDPQWGRNDLLWPVLEAFAARR
jgi:hypothetical protein